MEAYTSQVVAAYHTKKGAASGTFRLLFDGHTVKEDDTPDKVCPAAVSSAEMHASSHI